MIIEDNFANEIFSKFVDETADSHIDLLDGKYNECGGDVIPTIADEFLANFNSLLEQDVSSSLSTTPEIFCLSPSSTPPPFYYQPQNTANVFEFQYKTNVQNTQSPINTLNFDTDQIISSVPADIKRELEVVDELVRAHSRHASDCEDITFSIKSEYASSITSNGSSFGDDENLKVIKKRGYRRNPEERKSRKKEQNKTAAIRYRRRKKQEIEVYMDEGKILERKNRQLLKEYKETRREVRCLRSLMRELFQIRGFI